MKEISLAMAGGHLLLMLMVHRASRPPQCTSLGDLFSIQSYMQVEDYKSFFQKRRGNRVCTEDSFSQPFPDGFAVPMT